MSELNRIYKEAVFNALASFLAQEKIDSDTQLDIYLAVKKAALDLQESQLERLRLKISEWEQMYDEADTSLYTLGLRHAIDIITGEVATELNGYDGSKYEKEQTEGRETI